MSAPAAGAASPWRDAVISRIEQATPRIKRFFLDAPLAPHIAGQHVDVRLTAPDGYEARRSYSIASAPGAPQLELIIERLDDGEVSPFFHDVAQVGDTIEVRGPLGGHFIWSAAAGGPLLLVAGGSGIAPLMAMVRAWAAQGAAMPALLVCSARTARELVFHDELLALQAREPGFDFVAVTTREAARRDGDLDRRLDAAALRELLARWGHAPRHVYVCGANPFVEAVAGGLVDAGIAPAFIRTERYGGGD